MIGFRKPTTSGELWYSIRSSGCCYFLLLFLLFFYSSYCFSFIVSLGLTVTTPSIGVRSAVSSLKSVCRRRTRKRRSMSSSQWFWFAVVSLSFRLGRFYCCSSFLVQSRTQGKDDEREEEEEGADKGRLWDWKEKRREKEGEREREIKEGNVQFEATLSTREAAAGS